ncbi:MAG: M14 family metallopeptidase [Pirellulales bacterium]
MGYYSPDYFTARKRFVAAAARLEFAHHALPIDAPSPNAEPLSIDVAVAGAAKPQKAVVVSSGVHGVEGLFGSAVQLAFLDGLPPNWRPPDGAALVMIHALNPFGFAWQRRFNEDNVDLNRNFLLAEERYTGSPPLSSAFRTAMLSHRPRRRFNFWTARMALLAMRHGLRSFWETLPVGQYDFPDWLFFGGHARSQTVEALDRLIPTLLGGAEETVHLDFHTGLGRWTNCQLLLSEATGTESAAWWQRHFGAENVKAPAASRGSYQVRGGLGPWLRARLPDCHYRYATAEFGTYSPSRVVRELINELRWHAKLGAEGADHWARRRLTDTFVPRSRRWRNRALVRGLSLINRAVEVLWLPAEKAGLSAPH